MSKDAWKRFSDDGYKHYDVVSAGFKYNMTDIQASLGVHQLARYQKYHEKRCRLWEKYDNVIFIDDTFSNNGKIDNTDIVNMVKDYLNKMLEREIDSDLKNPQNDLKGLQK